MGAKDSKPSFISYEDATKRVSENELRRIREAFKRCAGANGPALSLEAFVHEVLCDGVPYEVAEWLYQACGGTKKGITFKDLLCGVVVLTKGNLEEKIKFLWTLYVNNQSDNGTYIYKRDFASALHLENTSLPVNGAHRTAEVLTSLFGPGERVTFEQFRSWLLIHKDATVLSKWLLFDGGHVTQDLETPTFYQSLAGVTHLEERDIIELEKCFWALRNAAPSGQLDLDSLAPLVSPPLPRAAVRGTFLAFDENRDGHVDFKELCCGLSAACRGPTTERLKFCFKIFDLDRDGMLNKNELVDMVDILCTVANESLKNQGSRASTPDSESDSDKSFDPDVVLLNLRDKLVTLTENGRKPLFQLGSVTEDIVAINEANEGKCNPGTIGEKAALTAEDFLIWSVEKAEALVTPFLELVVQVCHVVLGLRPHCRHQELDIVLGWVRRESRRGLRVGQFWYLAGAEWWGAWRAHCAAPPHACCRPAARAPDDAALCDDSFTTTSTESMGSLLWRAETASLGSAGSSSGVSSAPPHARPPHPGPIDNRRLLAPDTLKVRTLTGEGGHLRRDVTLAQHRDFELLPDALWRALALWYGGPDPLPRQVIRPPNSDVELELYPLQLKILRHIPNTQRLNVGISGAALYGSGAVSVAGSVPPAPVSAPAPPERQLAYTAAFSRLATVRQVSEFLCGALGLAREDVRLWALEGGGAVLLDDERPTLHELRLERARLLLELRNPDLTWPEEIGALSAHGGAGRVAARRETLTAPDLPGATGLHNLGNTCFMNAALQSVWNTGPLTKYFNSGMHLYEVNTTNPLGTKGVLALRYGELCKEVWSCGARSVAPLRVRGCVSRHARSLAGGGQHDAQELLAWLLDALHEDLNRAATPPPPPAATPAPSAAPAAPAPDQVVAAEAWEQFTSRNRSIITDLFYGQLKSKVRCTACGRQSVRFDTFNMLSLPLPMESFVRAEVRVILLDGSVPIKYGVRVNSEGTYLDLKKKLSELCGLPPESMALVLVAGARVARVLGDAARLAPATACDLFAYETPRPDRDEPDCLLDDECCGGASAECACSCCACAGAGGPAGGAGAAGGTPGAEVSVCGAARSSSLCMPALFCFKRSRSEILMSQSPPNTFYKSQEYEYRSNTLPKERRDSQLGGNTQVPRDGVHRAGNTSPTLSVKSLNLKPSTPRLPRVKFASSPSNMYQMSEVNELPGNGKVSYVVAVHRKQCRSDAYFLPWQRSRPALFGVPLLVPWRAADCGRALYARVWAQLARLLSARPPPRPARNHAADCDDSLGYEFPFTLRVVCGGGVWCALCPWPALCRGCALPSDGRPLLPHCRVHGCRRGRTQSAASAASEASGASGTSWASGASGASGTSRTDSEAPDSDSPVAQAKLHRHTRSRLSTDLTGGGAVGAGVGGMGGAGGAGDGWVPDARQLRNALRRGRVLLAIDWDPTALHLRYQSTREKAWVEHESVAECLAAEGRAVDLGSCLRAFTSEERLDERYHCEHCRAAQPATKALQLWRAPPVLIIHLKRFQYVNNKWIKSQKVVNFPFHDFDPTPYLASVPQETILRHQELKNKRRSSMFDVENHISEDDSEGEEPTEQRSTVGRLRRESIGVKRRERLESTSLVTTPVTDDNLVDYHQHHLKKDQDPFDLKYRLYAVVSHSGQLSGGHYVAYVRHPSGAWLCYNDSSCREVPAAPAPQLDAAAAYLLFYERAGLDAAAYLPDVRGRAPPDPPPDPAADADLRNVCSLV